MLVLLQEILPTSQISLSGQNDHYNSHDDDDDHDDYDDDDDDDDDVDDNDNDALDGRFLICRWKNAVRPMNLAIKETKILLQLLLI